MQRGLIIDAVVVGILVFAIVRGWRHGSLREGLGLLGLFGGIALAPALAGPLASLIDAFSEMPLNMARLIALLTIIAVIQIAIILIGRRKTRDAELGGPRWLDRVGAVVLATFRAVTVAALFLYSLLAISASSTELPGFTQGVMESVSGEVLADAASPVAAFYDGLIARTDDMHALTLSVRQQTGFRESVRDDRVRFAAVTDDVRPAREAEKELFELMNEERRDAGVEPLEWCAKCAEVARRHSKDMYAEGYFSHVDDDGVDPFDRMRKARIAYESAGENLAIAPDAREAHRGLMASLDHRANIMQARFDEVGIGVYSGPYGLMCTQVFREAP